MTRLIPKAIADDEWRQIGPHRPHAFLANPEDNLYFRLGVGKSLYLELVTSQMSARLINLVSYDAGDTILLQNLPNLGSVTVGRGAQCTIKILNPIVSRLHVEFYLSGNILVAMDMGSSNGTFIHPTMFGFDIDRYLEDRPVETSRERTLDHIHEAFGPTLDDFLLSYTKKKKELPS